MCLTDFLYQLSPKIVWLYNNLSFTIILWSSVKIGSHPFEFGVCQRYAIPRAAGRQNGLCRLVLNGSHSRHFLFASVNWKRFAHCFTDNIYNRTGLLITVFHLESSIFSTNLEDDHYLHCSFNDLAALDFLLASDWF